MIFIEVLKWIIRLFDPLALWVIKNFSIEDDPLPEGEGQIQISVTAMGTGHRANAMVEKAYELVSNYQTAHLVFHGGNGPCGGGNRELREADYMWAYYVSLVRSAIINSVFLESESKTTHQIACAALKRAKEIGAASIIVVSEPWHARIVRKIFRKKFNDSGISVHVVKSEVRYLDDPEPGLVFTSPAEYICYDLPIWVRAWLKAEI